MAAPYTLGAFWYNPAALPAGMKVDGDLWVSLTTGLLIESDFKASLISKYVYASPKTSNERKVAEHVHTSTKRIPPK